MRVVDVLLVVALASAALLVDGKFIKVTFTQSEAKDTPAPSKSSGKSISIRIGGGGGGRGRRGGAAAAAAAAAAGPASTLDPKKAYPNLLAAINEGGLTTLAAAVKVAGLKDLLDDPDATYTLLAPSDAAFQAYLAKAGVSAEDLLKKKEAVGELVSYHILPDAAVTAAELKDGTQVKTLLFGADAIPLGVSVAGGKASFVSTDGSGGVVTPDIKAGKSVLHVIDAVLVPPVIPKVKPAPAIDTTKPTPKP